MWLLLVFRNLKNDAPRFLAAVAGVAFAALLMAFEAGLLVGFSHAASRVIDSIEADVWLVRRGTRAFDLGFGVDRDLKHHLSAERSIRAADEVTVGWTTYLGPLGQPMSVQVVGIGKQLENRVRSGAASGPSVQQFSTDRSYASALGVDPGSRAEVGGHLLISGSYLDGFASFMGTPFINTDLPTSRMVLGFPTRYTSFVAAKFASGVNHDDAIARLRDRLPHLEVISSFEFSWRSRLYWLLQTGAGGALVLCTLLGFAIGLAIVSQTIYSLTMDRIDEFATLKAIGAPLSLLFGMVLVQALICTAVGALVGLIAVQGVAAAAQYLVPWCEQPWWISLVIPLLLLPMSFMAALVAARPAMKLEPAKAFRA